MKIIRILFQYLNLAYYVNSNVVSDFLKMPILKHSTPKFQIKSLKYFKGISLSRPFYLILHKYLTKENPLSILYFRHHVKFSSLVLSYIHNREIAHKKGKECQVELNLFIVY